MTHSEQNDRKNLLAVNMSLAANVVLAALKTGVGIVGNSRALLADGINSTSDVAYLVIVRVFMRLAGKPPDREHPYGHRQLESIAAVVVGAFVVTTGVAVFWDAIHQVFDLWTGRVEPATARVATLWVALFTLLVKALLTVLCSRVGRQTDSIAVLALARDHRNDMISITTAAMGIGMARAGYVWVDPLAAALVGLVILYTGVGILRESSADLMDILPSRHVRERIDRLIAAVPGVERVEEVRVHCIGYYLLINVIIGIDGNLTVAAGDRIANQVEETLDRELEYVRHVSVHFHPSEDADQA